MTKFLLFLILTGCNAISMPPADLGRQEPDDGSAEMCYSTGQLCSEHSQCCSGECSLQGWYTRCSSDSKNRGGRLPFGYNEKQCQYDACDGPGNFDPSFDPIYGLK